MNGCGHQDIVIRSLVDPANVSADERRRMQSCPECRAGERSLRKDLERLGAAAREVCPEPRGFFLPATAGKKRGRVSPRFTRRLAPIFACAVAAVLVLGVFRMIHDPASNNTPDVAAILREMEEDHLLLNEIDRMVFYAQTGAYMDGAGAFPSAGAYMDADFIRFLLPLEDDLSSRSMRRHPRSLV